MARQQEGHLQQSYLTSDIIRYYYVYHDDLRGGHSAAITSASSLIHSRRQFGNGKVLRGIGLSRGLCLKYIQSFEVTVSNYH